MIRYLVGFLTVPPRAHRSRIPLLLRSSGSLCSLNLGSFFRPHLKYVDEYSGMRKMLMAM